MKRESMGNGRRCRRGVARVVQHRQSCQRLHVRFRLGLLEDVASALLVDIALLLVEVLSGASDALRMVIGYTSATTPGVR
jgi:hypothetical protein